MTWPCSHVGCDSFVPGAALTATIRLLPSARAVEMFPSPSTKAMRLPSCDQAASVTVVGNVTGTPPIMTVGEPSETSGVPTAHWTVGALAVGLGVKTGD